MQIKFIISFVIFLSFSFTKGQAQNFVEDFEKINRLYTTGVDMSFSYNYYNYYNSIKPDRIVSGHMKSYKSMFKILMGDVEIINGKHLKAIVNHNGKTLTLDSAETKEMTDYFNENSIGKLTANYEKVEYIDKGNSATYKIFSKNGLTVYSEITVNKASFVIESIGIYFMDQRDDFRKGAIRNKLVINYSNVRIGIRPPDSEFSLDKFVYKTNEKYSIKDAYKHYEFINMISK